jgi:hypothetical protein
MRNVWKGLMLGAVTGAAIGLTMDSGRQAGRRATELANAAGRALREHGPEVGAVVASAASRGAEQLREADLPGKARDLGARIGDSSLGDTARDAAEQARAQARDLRSKGSDTHT